MNICSIQVATLARQYRVYENEIKILVVEAMSTILNMLDRKQANKAEKYMVKHGVEILKDSPIVEVTKDSIKLKDGKRYVVFLYVANKFTGELKSSSEGDIFWYPLSELHKSDELIDGFGEMLDVFLKDEISEVFYESCGVDFKTVYY